MNTLRRSFSLAVLLGLLPALVLGQSLPEPKGRAVLTVSGKIGVKNRGETAAFDMAMLEALPQHSFTTRTPWYDRPVKFTGPLLSDLLDAVKAQGGTVSATAINDYTIRIPVADAKEQGAIVARLLDDQPMAVRDKGPLWVVYPYDTHSDYQAEVIYARSIWQVAKIEFK